MSTTATRIKTLMKLLDPVYNMVREHRSTLINFEKLLAVKVLTESQVKPMLDEIEKSLKYVNKKNSLLNE